MPPGAEVRAPCTRPDSAEPGHRAAGSAMRIAAHRSPGSARHRAATSATRPPTISAAPCAFSLTTHITQRDGRQGTDAPGSRTHVPEPGRWMCPGWRPSPRSPAVSGHPADSPAVPESVLEPRRHQGIPAGAPAHPCAVTRSQLHHGSDGPRAVRTTDEDASAATIQEDPVGSIMPVIKDQITALRRHNA
jgi:hypothetical protein